MSDVGKICQALWRHLLKYNTLWNVGKPLPDFVLLYPRSHHNSETSAPSYQAAQIDITEDSIVLLNANKHMPDYTASHSKRALSLETSTIFHITP
jgi:hypothetical protein